MFLLETYDIIRGKPRLVVINPRYVLSIEPLPVGSEFQVHMVGGRYYVILGGPGRAAEGAGARGSEGERTMSRPSWVETWSTVAAVFAQRSTCPRTSAGAVLVSADNQVLSSGYNGAPRGLPHCADVGCRMEGNHCVRALHAEANALLQAARLGIRVEGSTCYCTHRPCQRCTLLLIQAGVSAIYFRYGYPSDDEAVAKDLALGAGVTWGRIV